MIYLAKYNKKLFKEDIICFLNGGIVIEAWKKWHFYTKQKIKDFEITKINEQYSNEKIFLKKFVKIFKKHHPTTLVEISHLDPSWIKNSDLILKKQKQNVMKIEKHCDDYKKTSLCNYC